MLLPAATRYTVKLSWRREIARRYVMAVAYYGENFGP